MNKIFGKFTSIYSIWEVKFVYKSAKQATYSIRNCSEQGFKLFQE